MNIELGVVAAAAVGYVLGSIPTAWLIVRAVAGKDLRREGSANIGARNSYDVTGKASIGITVALLDALKGASAVWCARLVGGDFLATAAAAVSVVLGHNWSVWLRGRGGRGLAPAAGVSLAINPLPLVLWMVMYVTGYFAIRRHVHVGNVAGTLGTALLIFNTPGALLHATAWTEPFNVAQFKLAMIAICLAILVRHIEPVRQLLNTRRETSS